MQQQHKIKIHQNLSKSYFDIWSGRIQANLLFRAGASAQQPAYCINHRLLERCGPALHLCYTLYFSLHMYLIQFQLCIFVVHYTFLWTRILYIFASSFAPLHLCYQARARARRACALRALGLLLADGAPTVGRGKTFWLVNKFFLRKLL